MSPLLDLELNMHPQSGRHYLNHYLTFSNQSNDPALAYEEALETSKLQPLSIRRDVSCKKFVESLRRDASPYNPLTKIMEISPRIRTHDYDLRNDHSDQTLLPVMSDRFKNFVTRKYY